MQLTIIDRNHLIITDQEREEFDIYLMDEGGLQVFCYEKGSIEITDRRPASVIIRAKEEYLN